MKIEITIEVNSIGNANNALSDIKKGIHLAMLKQLITDSNEAFDFYPVDFSCYEGGKRYRCVISEPEDVHKGLIPPAEFNED